MDKKPERLVPEVRFKGFTDDWEQRKLGEISERILRKNSDLQSLLPLTISAQDGLVDQTIYFNKQVASKQLKNYLLLYNGDFAYNKSYSVGYPYGAIKRLDRYKQGVLSTLYIAFKPTNINSDFLQHYYDTDKWYREIYRNAAEGARNHGLLNISANDFFNSKLITPSDNDEQLKIAKIINVFNRLITLQQRKLEQLTQLKKALQQKLFPNSFQEKPLLRILHGDNSWWNSYIGEVFTERVDKGSSEKLLSVSITDGVYPFDESKRKNNSSNDKHNYKKVFQNDIAYNSMRLWQGALGVSKYEGIVSPAYTVLKPLANQNSIFYEFMFKNIDMLHIFQRNSQGLTSDTWNLKFNQLQHIKIKTTNLNSQNKIAKLLIKIEELKNNESNYYHNLMILKKYLLQKLFI